MKTQYGQNQEWPNIICLGPDPLEKSTCLDLPNLMQKGCGCYGVDKKGTQVGV